MKEKRQLPENHNSLLNELMQLTRSALYRFAQILGIPKRSQMTKSQLVEALSQKQDETVTVMDEQNKNDSSKYNDILNTLPSSVSVAKRPVRKIREDGVLHTGQIRPVQQSSSQPLSISSAMPEPTPKTERKEPESVWVGEEGPDLPSGYGVTVLRAMPRDPHWAYLYWEISKETREQIRKEEGEWYFDIAVPLIRVFNEQEELIQEIPVLLDANCWYLNLYPNESYHFELGLKNRDGVFRTLVRSNRLTLPPMEPSNKMDEEWAIVNDEFQEVIYHAAGLELSSGGASPSMIPHVLRHRMRIPWNWESEEWPSSPSGPSSHIMPSSHTIRKK